MAPSILRIVSTAHPLGTHERFISFLIEHFGGAFPTWMAPLQVRVVPISDEGRGFCAKN